MLTNANAAHQSGLVCYSSICVRSIWAGYCFFVIFSCRSGNARSQRRERRAEARKAATAVNVGNNDVTAKETDTAVEAKQQDRQKDVDAEQANIEESNTTPIANVVAEATNAKTAVEAVEAKTCDLCDKTF